MTTVYICKNNTELIEVEKDILFFWEDEYIGRPVIPDKYKSLFDINGYYPKVYDYEIKDISLNLRPETDADGIITEINSYKFRDLTVGHGRPVSNEMSINRTDIKLFRDVLDSVTENIYAKEYDLLIQRLQEHSDLPNNYHFEKAGKTGITLRNPDGDKITLTHKKALRGLMISHKYVDVLYSEDTLKEAHQYFDPSDIPAYLAIYSQVNYKDYPHIETLLEEAHNRELIRTTEDGYLSLVNAVYENDWDNIQKYADYARFYFWDPDEKKAAPLAYAVDHDLYALAELLLQHGAFSRDTLYVPYHRTPVLEIAVQHKNYEMIELIVKYHGADHESYPLYCNAPDSYFKIDDIYDFISQENDIRALQIILPYAKGKLGSSFSPKNLPYSFEQVAVPLSKIQEAHIVWTKPYIEEAYNTSRELCHQMLEQGGETGVDKIFIQHDDFEMFEACLNGRVALNNDGYTEVYTKDSKWYQAVAATGRAYGLVNERDKYLASLIRSGQYQQYMDIIMLQGWKVPVCSLDGFSQDTKHSTHYSSLETLYGFLLDRLPDETHYSPHSTTIYNVCFNYFRASLFKNGSPEICRRCLQKFSNLFLNDVEIFIAIIKSIVTSKNDDLLRYAAQFKIDHDPEWTYDMIELIYELHGYCYGMNMNDQIAAIKIILEIADIKEMDKVFQAPNKSRIICIFNSTKEMLGSLYSIVCNDHEK